MGHQPADRRCHLRSIWRRSHVCRRNNSVRDRTPADVHSAERLHDHPCWWFLDRYCRRRGQLRCRVIGSWTHGQSGSTFDGTWHCERCGVHGPVRAGAARPNHDRPLVMARHLRCVRRGRRSDDFAHAFITWKRPPVLPRACGHRQRPHAS